MEYKITGYRKSDLVRLDIKINAEVCAAHHMLMLHPSGTKYDVDDEIYVCVTTYCYSIIAVA